MINRLTHIIFVAVFTPVLAGCFSVTERSPYAGLDLSAYKDKQADQYSIFWNEGWWSVYQDEQLNSLMAYAFEENPDLNQIRARLKQAQAETRASRSVLFPALDVTGGRSEFDGNNNLDSEFDLRGGASFEIDLWGENRARVKSRTLLERAARYDLYAGAITLSANIANNWLQILSLREQEAIIRKQIEVNKTVLDLQEQRFERGGARALDVLQQEENLARSEALLPDILANQRVAENNISILIGRTPSETVLIDEKLLPEPLDLPPSGLPSLLLEDRPDIEAAWSRLISADWAQHAAFADRLPRFDLSANYTSTSASLGNLFDTWLLELAASVSAPIIDGGRRRAEELRQEAIADENYFAYQGTVLAAVQDVENALVQNLYQDKKISALGKQLEASRKTLEQAQFSYINGESGYINVLNSLTNSQGLELQIATEKLVQAQNRVSLYRALGGRSWAEVLVKQDVSDE